MKFWEAMKYLEEGKKIRKVYWNENEYYYLDDDFVTRNENNNYIVISYEGNEEWEIYEEKKDVDPRFKEFYHYLKDEHGFVNNQYTDYINDHNEPDYLLKFYQQLLDMAKYYKLD